ncbi:MAG TPA: hypothetical protein VM821_02685 [Abditibacteriaceae bacterium]|nr:hypothetical protein [Abditibacteriaceae bacterium]
MASIGVASVGMMSCAQTPPAAESLSFEVSSSQHVWTSTREINALCMDKSGALWAATSGGVLRRAANGTWRKWTRENGLPSHEVRTIQCAKDQVSVQTPHGASVWSSDESGNEWKAARDISGNKPPIQWNGARVFQVLEGLRIVGKSSTRNVPVPGNGTHISALWPRRQTLLAASFGDNVYQWDGKSWQSLNLVLPTQVRDITALCEDAPRRTLWIGTRRAGVWRCDLATQKVSQSSSHGSEPMDHNAQALAVFGGRLWVSTLEDGLASFSGKLWENVAAGQISSVAPRQMTKFRGSLWVRHGDGQVDKWDGRKWAKNVFTQLPRHKVFALAADENRLIAVQWGGWSEWDGARWTHHFEVPQLQNAPVVSVLPEGETLWLGTQNRGLVEYSMTRKTVRVHDERSGLPDDWITSLCKVGDQIHAGTFVGGLARWNGAKWTTQPELKGENITAIEPSANNGDDASKLHDAFVATRHGVWKVAEGTAKPLASAVVDPEAQTLLQTPRGVWIGARTGLSFVRTEHLKN